MNNNIRNQIFNLPEGSSSGSSWTHPLQDEYKTLLAVVSQKPSKVIQDAQNTFIYYLKGGNSDLRNVWDKLSCIIPYFAGMSVANDATIWWNNPARKAILSITPPTYVAGKGFTGNGISSYINSTFNPITDGDSLFTRDDASAGWMFMNDRITPSNGGCGNNEIQLAAVYATDIGYIRINNEFQAIVGGNASTNHLFTLVRKSSSLCNVFRDRVPLASDISKVSIAVGNYETYTLAINNNGTVLAGSYLTDVVGLEFKGSQLDQIDINVVCDAIDELMFAIASATPILDYAADGTIIDTNIWTITNPNPTIVEFEQNNAIIMRSYNSDITDVVANNIKTTFNMGYGIISGSLLDIKIANPNTIFRGVVLTFNVSSHLSLQRNITNATGNISFRINKEGNYVYTLDTGEKEFVIFKIKYSPTHAVSFYKWSNDAWVLIGVVNGGLSLRGWLTNLYMASQGRDLTETHLRDIYITQKDFNTMIP